MLGEDGESAEDEDSPMTEEELPVIAKRAATPRLQEKQRKETTLEVACHINEEEGMAEVEELITSAICATNGSTDLLNALKQRKLVRGEHFLHILKRLRHRPKKQKM